MNSVRRASIVLFWLPLAATWFMMGVEGPYIAAIVARMPAAEQSLAAFGVATSLAWLVESPIMMLFSAATALVHDRASYLALRRFSFILCGLVAFAMFLLGLAPVFRIVGEKLIGLPPEIAHHARTATVILILWPAAIGYRRFYQGVLVRHHLTRRVAYGTVVRLVAMSMTAALLAMTTRLAGATIGACALMAGVVTEAIASRRMARNVVRDLMSAVIPSREDGEESRTGKRKDGQSERDPSPSKPALSEANGRLGMTRSNATLLDLPSIARFYYPLALTSILSMALGPLVTFGLGRGRAPVESLAVWPVITAVVFLFRSGGVAFQEVGVALMRERDDEVSVTATRIGVLASLALAAMALTPLQAVWFERVSGLSPYLASFAVWPMRILIILPVTEYVLSMQRARLILAHSTGAITIATAIETGGLAVALLVILASFDVVGATAGAVAMIAGRLAANAFLATLRAR